MSPEERAKRMAEAIAKIGQGLKPTPIPKLSEREAEELHQLAQARKLK